MSSSTKKEVAKKMLIKQTIATMNKQIQKLEEQKKTYIEAGKQAKQKGLTAQYNLALAGLRMTIAQQRRVYEMKLNFEITSQMKDMSLITQDFLKGMSSLSKDMLKLSKDKDFVKVQRQFEEAMMGIEVQTERMEEFMDQTEAAFATSSSGSEEDKAELESVFTNEAATEGSTESEIEKELEDLKKKMG